MGLDRMPEEQVRRLPALALRRGRVASRNSLTCLRPRRAGAIQRRAALRRIRDIGNMAPFPDEGMSSSFGEGREPREFLGISGKRPDPTPMRSPSDARADAFVEGVPGTRGIRQVHEAAGDDEILADIAGRRRDGMRDRQTYRPGPEGGGTKRPSWRSESIAASRMRDDAQASAAVGRAPASPRSRRGIAELDPQRPSCPICGI